MHGIGIHAVTSQRPLSRKGGFVQGWGLFIVFVALCAFFSLTSPAFLKALNLVNVVRQVSILGIASVGLSLLMIAGGIDISIGSHLALSGLIIAILMNNYKVPITVAMVCTLCASAAIGTMISFFVTTIRIPPLIATLGMQSVLRGLGYVISGGYPVYNLPPSFLALGKGYIGPIPIPVIIMLVLFALGYLFLNKTYLGRHFYALGGNEEAARLSGINVTRLKYLAYGICAVLASLAGLILLGRINSAQPSAGNGFEFDVITAVVLGGVSISGGVGKMQNVFLGVLIIGVLNNGLILLDVHDYYQMVIKGLILILAVGVDAVTGRK